MSLAPTEQELLIRYPSVRFLRYPRGRPYWSIFHPRRLRFLYVEMLADLLRSQCTEVKQMWQKDGVQLVCSSGEAYFCSYRYPGVQVVGHQGTTLANQVEDLFSPPSADPQSGVSLAHAEEEKVSRLFEAILALDASFPQELIREEARRRTLSTSLFVPFIYALLIVGLALGHYPGRQLFGKGELFLAAGVALVPALGKADDKFKELRKAKLYALRLTSFYYFTMIMLMFCNFTLWLLLTIAAEHPAEFHAGWVAEWGGIAAVLIAFGVLATRGVEL